LGGIDWEEDMDKEERHQPGLGGERHGPIGRRYFYGGWREEEEEEEEELDDDKMDG